MWTSIAEQVQAVNLVPDSRSRLLIKATDELAHWFAAEIVSVVDSLQVTFHNASNDSLIATCSDHLSYH